MTRSDKHLAEVLEEYNARVHECEERGTEEQKLDAYIMRGTVLSLQESYVSAYTDFEEAIEIITDLEMHGKKVDPGTFVKAYVSRGELQYFKDSEAMADDYAIAASRLKYLDDDSRYYTWKEIVQMCLDCGEDLLHSDCPRGVSPFFRKIEDILMEKDDEWSLNRSVDALNMIAQSEQNVDRYEASLDYLNRSVELGRKLMEKNILEDKMALITALALRGDVRLAVNDIKTSLKDYEEVISILEGMLDSHRPELRELLIETHRDASQLYEQIGNIKEAERHLTEVLQLNLCDDIDGFD